MLEVRDGGTGRGIIATLLTLALCAARSAAAPGDLDAAFGRGGIVTTNVAWDDGAAGGRAVLRQRDGKLVVAGQGWDLAPGFGLVRYHSDGTVDTGFGDRGRVITLVGEPWGFIAGESTVTGVVQQADGKLVVAGRAGSNDGIALVLVRYTDDGSLDPTFGTSGILTVPITGWEYATALAQQLDGKLVAAGYSFLTGDVFLVRLAADGALDASFGTEGVVMLDLGGNDLAHALVVQDDGKLVVAGSSDDGVRRIVLARVDAAGVLDSTFGSGGVATTVLGGSDDEALALVQQADGKLVAAGRGFDDMSLTWLVVLRYEPDGTLDGTFGIGGVVLTPEAGTLAYPRGVLEQPDGRIVVAGDTRTGSDNDLVAVRYQPDGSLDGSFGIGGVAKVDAGPGDQGYALLRQPDGKLVLGGGTYPTWPEIAVVRLDEDGALDPTFGGDGTVSTSAASSWDTATAMVVQPDGKVVTAGFSRGGGWTKLALVRHEADGAVDVTFGDEGRVTTQIGVWHATATGVVRLDDGRIVVGGWFDAFDGRSRFVLARYEANGTLDTTFGDGGIVATAVGFGNAYAGALIRLEDGKLVQGGSAATVELRSRSALVRYHPDGTLDGEFGTDGVVVGPFAHTVNAILEQPDGKLVTAGGGFAVSRHHAGGAIDTSFGVGGVVHVSASGATSPGFTALLQQPDGRIVAAGDVVIARFTMNGALDPTFAGDGVVTGSILHHALVRQADGRIVAAGATLGIPHPRQVAVGRYHSSGAVDATFGDGGVAVAPAWRNGSEATAVALVGDEKIVAAGYGNSDVILARYFTRHCGDGVLDAGEACDAGTANGEPWSCCTAACAFASAGTPCPNGACDAGGVCVATTMTTSTSTSTTAAPSSTTSTSTSSTSTTSACADADADGLCDADDPCTNIGGTRTATRAKLKAARLLPPSGDDVLAVSGVIIVPTAPTVDPAANGLRVLYGDATGIAFDAFVPGGTYDPVSRVGWTVRNGSFKWVDGTGASHLVKVMLKASAGVPGSYKVTIKGRKGAYAVAEPPVGVTVVLDHPRATGGQCGEWRFPAPPPALPSCVRNRAGSTLKCR